MKTILITGTSRGIGLELVRQSLTAGDRVMAVARHPEKSSELSNLRETYPQHLALIAADVATTDGVAQIRKVVESEKKFDVLINNAGIYLKGHSPEDFAQSFAVNSVAPFLLAQAVLPFLKSSTSPKLVSITSKMGSIADNTSGGSYAYRASKAALNAIHQSLRWDHPWLTTLLIHPGWVQTDMGGGGANVPVSESARGIWAQINGARPETSGRFVDYRGQEISW